MEIKNKSLIKNIFYYTVFIILFFFMAFRGINVGTDNQMYSEFYYSIANDSLTIANSTIEIGFSFYWYILSHIGLSYEISQIITSLIIILPFVFFIKKFSKDIFLSIFIYFTLGTYFLGYNGIRQQFALSFILWGIFLFLKYKKILWYVIFSVIAVLFHYSSFIFLLIIPLFYIKIDWRLILIGFLILTVLMLFAEPLINFFSQNSNIFYIDKYINTSYFNKKVQISSFILTIAYLLVLLFLLIFQKYDKQLIQKDNTWMFNFFISAVLIRYCSLFGVFPYLILRYFDYLSWVIIFLMPEILFNIKSKNLKNALKWSGLCCLFMLFVFQIFIFGNGNVWPYYFFFS